MTGRRAIGGDDDGLTLVEMLIALAIVSVGLLGLVSIVPVSSRAVAAGHQLSTATFLAEQMMERVRAATWTAAPVIDCLGVSAGDVAPVPTASGCHGLGSTRFPDEPSVAGHPGYRRVVRVAACGTTPCAGITDAALRLATVAVTYRGVPVGGQPGTDATVTLEWLTTQK